MGKIKPHRWGWGSRVPTNTDFIRNLAILASHTIRELTFAGYP